MSEDQSARLGLPYLAAGQMQKHVTLNELEPGVVYRARYVNPRTGEPREPFQISGDDGTAELDAGMSVTVTPTGEDWVLLLERT